MISRDLAGELEKVLGQPVVIENRPGANGSTATAALVASKPDGQTLMMILSGHITNAFLYPGLGFDPLKDVTPVSLVASSPLAIVANPNFGPSDIKSLVEAAKAKPGTISYGTPGVASIQQLSLELMAFMTGTKFVHVPYRGGAPALNDAIGGHVPLAVLSVLQVMPQVEAKQLKPLAVTSKGRTDVWPNVPSIAEAGVTGYEAELWFGVIAPAGTPDAIVDGSTWRSPASSNRTSCRSGSPRRARAPSAPRARVRRLHARRTGEVGQGAEGNPDQAGVSSFAGWVTPCPREAGPRRTRRPARKWRNTLRYSALQPKQLRPAQPQRLHQDQRLHVVQRAGVGHRGKFAERHLDDLRSLIIDAAAGPESDPLPRMMPRNRSMRSVERPGIDQALVTKSSEVETHADFLHHLAPRGSAGASSPGSISPAGASKIAASPPA